MSDIKIEYVKLSDLKAYDKNARQHSEQQILQVMNSISEFSFTNPVLIDENNVLIAGHGRSMAAERLGMFEVPAIRLVGLSEDKRKALRIADNQIALNSTWDMDLLAQEIQDLQLADYDIDILGFSDEEIDSLLNGLSDDEDSAGLTDDDQVPEPPELPKTKLGDIYILGSHRLMCGDSTSIDAVEKLMDGQKADMVFTDPPYNQNTQKGGGKGALADSLRKQSDDIGWICDFDPNEFLNCLPFVFSNTINAYVFCNKDLLPEYLLKARELDASFWVLIWKKEGAIPINSAHYPDIEYLVVMRKKSIFNSGVKDVNYSRLIRCNRDKAGLHPTMKPIELIENQLLIGSNPNSSVVDFFGGSGSTMIACEKVKRRNFSMELSEKYCDVIIKRWQDFTGKDAILESTQQKFNEL